MGEGGSSGVAAIVNYDPSVTSPKIIAGKTPGKRVIGDLVMWERSGSFDRPAMRSLEIPPA